jgi:hypothetical protein
MMRHLTDSAIALPRLRRPLRHAVAAAMAALLATGPALAAAPAAKAVCYSRNEYAAEQAIRLHTELMVIGLTCQQSLADKNPFGKYQEFTVKNRSFISSNEGVMIEHFRRSGIGNPTRRFDMFRTELANEISRRAAIITSGIYCAAYGEMARSAIGLPQDEIRKLTGNGNEAQFFQLSSRPLCDVKVVSVPDGVALPASVEVGKAKVPAKAPAKAPARQAEAAATTTIAERR